MIFSTARVTTQHASRYLTRLSKHWRHRFAVEYTAEQARIPFAADRVCLLQADPDGLSIELEAPDHEAADALQQVVADHLLRMADRDELSPLEWKQV